jgi:phage regulator Rha-like protein
MQLPKERRHMELVTVKNNQIFTDSKIISDGVGIKHHSIQQLIAKYENDISEFGQLAFEMRPVKYSRGTNFEKIYFLNEEQATFIITLMRNNKTVVAFKKELVRQFYLMRQFIFERQSKNWIQTREQGKLTRKAETDVLKSLVEYAKLQGSEHSDKMYITYTKLANKICGVSGRDNATAQQLSNLTVAENIILHCIQAGIDENKHYKDIYKDCKKRLEMFKDIAYLEVA